MVEIKSINVLNTRDYVVELPIIEVEPEPYTRVASTFGYDTQTAELDVVAGTNTDDIEF
jgi:hypothetical protein